MTIPLSTSTPHPLAPGSAPSRPALAAIVPALLPALVAALIAPAPSEASEPPPTDTRERTQADASLPASGSVRVVVDASALGPDAAWFEAEIAKRYAEALAAEGFAVDEHGSATVRVKLDYFDERDRDFLIATDVVRDGRMAVTQRPAKCPACIDDELVDASVAQLPELIAALRSDPEQLPAEPTSTTPSAPPPTAVDTPAPAPGDRPRPIGPLGGVGIGVAAVGVGLTVWGAVELGRGVVYASPGGLDLYREGVDHRPRGRALVGAGVGAIVIGGAVLVTDLVLRRKQRKQSRTVSAAPVVTGDFVGLGWSGRF